MGSASQPVKGIVKHWEAIYPASLSKKQAVPIREAEIRVLIARFGSWEPGLPAGCLRNLKEKSRTKNSQIAAGQKHVSHDTCDTC